MPAEVPAAAVTSGPIAAHVVPGGTGTDARARKRTPSKKGVVRSSVTSVGVPSVPTR